MASAAHHAVVPTLASALNVTLDTIESGVSLDTMANFLSASGLELKDIYDIVIPARTLKHRRARHEALSRDESDKLARVIRIYDHARCIFGSPEKTLRFLRMPKSSLQDRSPLQLLRTDLGGRMVEDMLWQIADGVFV
jgi:putative toxin-antitoxin system antitoxin component (TIGR02293 family)